MKQITRLGVLAAMLAVVATGCAAARPKDATPMLIEKLPTNLWSTQTLLTANQHAEEQAMMVSRLKKLLHGKYRVTAQQIYFLPPDRAEPNPIIFKMEFSSVMSVVDPGGAELVFTNETWDWPYVNVWKASGPHPGYVALALYRTPDDADTLLGHFELAPTK